ncbi:hypothetical protein C8R45DRAFT_948004 [Mycena sanguinolenta]|nr:hypothetical protein C8R45DRAFT_948004 [Mycena sanguinolenta]
MYLVVSDRGRAATSACATPPSASQEVVVSTRRREREERGKPHTFHSPVIVNTVDRALPSFAEVGVRGWRGERAACRRWWHRRDDANASQRRGWQRARRRRTGPKACAGRHWRGAGDVRCCSGAVTAAVAADKKVAVKTGPAGRVLRYTGTAGTVKGSDEHGGVADETTKLFAGAVCVYAGYDFAREGAAQWRKRRLLAGRDRVQSTGWRGTGARAAEQRWFDFAWRGRRTRGRRRGRAESSKWRWCDHMSCSRRCREPHARRK